MWHRFTERARRVVFHAQQEAAETGDNHVSTVHLLLGLLHEEDSAGTQVLLRLETALDPLREKLRGQLVNHGSKPTGDMQLAPRGRRVIDLAFDEARRMSNNFIGTEHLLLGMVREKEGTAGKALAAAGVGLEDARRVAYSLQTERGAAPKSEDTSIRRPSIPTAELERLQPRPAVGDLGTLQGESPAAPVSVAPDEAAFREMLTVLTAKDFHGYRELLAQEKMTLVPAGTEAKLLRPERGEAYHVRILSGEREGQAGWVLRSHFHYTGPDTRPFPPPLEEG